MPRPKSTPLSLTPNSDTGGSGHPSEGGALSLQTAILNATNQSPALESLHRLLVPSTITQMLFAGNQELEKSSMDTPLLSLLRENITAITMLDILVSNHIIGQTAKSIVNMAVGRSRVVLDTLSPKVSDSHVSGRRSFKERNGAEKPIQGPIGVLHIISEVSGYFIMNPLVSSAQSAISPTHPISSPHSLLRLFPLQLRVEAIQGWKEFMDGYSEALEQVESRVQRAMQEGDVLEQLSTHPETPLIDTQIFEDLNSAMKLHMAPRFRHGEELEGWNGIPYLKYLSLYLSKFVKLILNSLYMDASMGKTLSFTSYQS